MGSPCLVSGCLVNTEEVVSHPAVHCRGLSPERRAQPCGGMERSTDPLASPALGACVLLARSVPQICTAPYSDPSILSNWKTYIIEKDTIVSSWLAVFAKTWPVLMLWALTVV